MPIRYDEIIPWGRSFEEYCDMFLLTGADLNRLILSVGDGPASFNARMRYKGQNVTSVDPAYFLSSGQFRNRIVEVYDTVINQTRQNRDKFIWERIKSIEELSNIRLSAMNEFCNDFDCGKTEGRYIPASLPALPFKSKSFDLILTGHLLFFYSGHYDLKFHLASIRELIRLGKEIRIFPIVDLNSERSPYLNSVITDLKSKNIHFSIDKVSYHFQKTGNEMLRIFSF